MREEKSHKHRCLVVMPDSSSPQVYIGGGPQMLDFDTHTPIFSTMPPVSVCCQAGTRARPTPQVLSSGELHYCFILMLLVCSLDF